ncbi:MAG: universal stress protein [Candidatus Puniceispirillaceae bacterium]|jgi:nucleotide-binding universal stress UspA family protein
MTSAETKFLLVLVDDSEELHQALHYACKRASAADMRIALLYVIAPAEFAHWAGVGELMRQEAREYAEEKMRSHADYVQNLTRKAPLMHIREGKAVDEVINLINDEKDISLLVLGADTKSDSAGPVVSYLTGRGVASCRIPIVIVPGNMTDEQIDAIT